MSFHYGLNFNEIPVPFYWWIMTCMLMRCKHDKWSNWWRHVVRMNYYASVLLYEFKILSSNFSLAWLHNSSAIYWHHPIITYCCNFVDDSHSRWSRHQPGWQRRWLTTTAVTFYEWVLRTISRKSESYGRDTAPHCVEHRSRPSATSRA